MNNLPEELKKQIPDKPKKDIEEGVKIVDDKILEIDELVNDKINQLDDLINIWEKKNIDSNVAETVGNVREILNNPTIDKSLSGLSEIHSRTDLSSEKKLDRISLDIDKSIDIGNSK